MATWREKLGRLEKERAIAASAAQKFELDKGINECQEEIQRLASGGTAGSVSADQKDAPPKDYWNVPIPPNPLFTGRDKVLKDLEVALKSRGSAALCGIGGLGKTETAAHYAHRHREEYRAEFWAFADSRDTLIRDFAAIAGLLQLRESGASDQNVTVAAVKGWFAAKDGWLLILDNANDLALVPEFIPQSGKGHLLLTTQAQALGPLAERIEIEYMEPEEGALFLLRRAGIIGTQAPLAAANQNYRNLAERISSEFDGLPLALDQAGAYMEETGEGLRGYRELYRQRGRELRRQRGGIPSGHPDSVATTFALSFARVEKASPGGADLLRLCAFLHPDAIPEEIITQGRAALGPRLEPLASDPLQFNAALREALKYSLVRRDPNAKTLSIHRMVQDVIKDAMEESQDREWAERTVQAVGGAFPRVEFKNWPLCERLLPQALACAALIEKWGFTFQAASLLLIETGHYLKARARFHEAEALYQRALAFLESAVGPEHLDVATSLNNLAVLYREQAKYEQAEPLYQRALAIRVTALGLEHPDVANSLNNLAVLYRQQGKYEQAEPLHQRALAIREKALGPEHSNVATSLNNLALLYVNQGKYEQAEPLHQRALAIREKTLGPEHPDVATSLSNLAALYDDQGKYEQAEPLHQRALAIREKALGPEHPEVANSLNNLAVLYNEQGKSEQAEPLHQRALTIWEKALGPHHPDVATSLSNLALLYRAQGKIGQAEPLHQRALAIREKALGAKHPKVANSLNNLAYLYREQGKYEKAEPLYLRALAIWEKALGREHPNVAAVLENYAVLLRETHREAEAEKLEARAKAIRETR